MSGDVRQEAGEEPGDGTVVGLRLRPVPAARSRAEHAAPPQQQPRHFRPQQGASQTVAYLSFCFFVFFLLKTFIGNMKVQTIKKDKTHRSI